MDHQSKLGKVNIRKNFALLTKILITYFILMIYFSDKNMHLKYLHLDFIGRLIYVFLPKYFDVEMNNDCIDIECEM